MAKKKNSSSEIISSDIGGYLANFNGNYLEKFVYSVLLMEGYTPIEGTIAEKHQAFANRGLVGGKQFAWQTLVGPTIYGTDRTVDFVVYNPDIFPRALIIECKWQQSNGTVDEKYPYLLDCIDRTGEEAGTPSIIVLDGGGYKPEAEKWLYDQVPKREWTVEVFSMATFQKAVNNGLFRQPLQETLTRS